MQLIILNWLNDLDALCRSNLKHRMLYPIQIFAHLIFINRAKYANFDNSNYWLSFNEFQIQITIGHAHIDYKSKGIWNELSCPLISHLSAENEYKDPHDIGMLFKRILFPIGVGFLILMQGTTKSPFQVVYIWAE